MVDTARSGGDPHADRRRRVAHDGLHVVERPDDRHDDTLGPADRLQLRQRPSDGDERQWCDATHRRRLRALRPGVGVAVGEWPQDLPRPRCRWPAFDREYRNGASILKRDLTWDAANRITAIADPASAANSSTYGYDVLDRLTSALSGSTPAVSRGYGYDAIGNRTTSTVGAASTTYAYPATSHRLQSLSGATTRSYGYDGTGNPTQIDAAVHGYNLANRLTSVSSTSSASYAINALGQRVAKTVDGVTTRYVYDEQGRLIGEYQADGTLIQETVWLDDLPIATLRPAGNGTPTPVAVYYVHADHLGSPRAITWSTDDAIVWRWDNGEPFGANAANENPSGLGTFRYDLRFPGR